MLKEPIKVLLKTGKEIDLKKGVYMDKELNALIGLELKSQMDDRDDVLRTNKLENVTKLAISLEELDNGDNLEDGRPSNTLFMYYVTGPEYSTRFQPHTPQYKKLKNSTIVSLALKITDQNNNIITSGPGMTRFPNLGSDDAIIPGTANLSFNIELSSTADPNRTLVSNVGRAIVKKLAVKFEGNEILNIDNFHVFACYRDLWKTFSEKRDAVRQGIISDDSCTINCIKLRINAGDKPMLLYGLCYELTFNDCNRVINSAKTDATYKITAISLEYEIVTQPTLPRSIADEYQNMALLYDRVLRHRL